MATALFWTSDARGGVMRAAFLILALLPVPALAQVSNYVGKNATPGCVGIFVVAPTITSDMLGGSF